MYEHVLLLGVNAILICFTMLRLQYHFLLTGNCQCHSNVNMYMTGVMGT